MAKPLRLVLRGETIEVPSGTSKADLARVLLEEDYTVSEISKAVPMAYSQVHKIAQEGKLSTLLKNKPLPKPPKALPPVKPITQTPFTRQKMHAARTKVALETAKFIEAEESGFREPVSRVSPLRGGKKLGLCSNCGYDLVGQKLGGQMQLVHTGMSAEEYLSEVQFCHAYPKSLPS